MTSADLAVLQSDILNTYYADNAKKLHKTVDRILCKFGGLSDKDTDDFYSLANEVFADVMKRYDYKQSFDGFLYSCLSNKIMTEITKRNREKRKRTGCAFHWMQSAVMMRNAICWTSYHPILTHSRK